MAQDYQVGVVIPTCKRNEFLRQALTSAVLAWESSGDETANICITVVDDGHQDSTRDLVNNAPRGLVTQIKYLRTPAGPMHGPAAARNHGIKNTRAKLIYFLDDDDQFLPNRFENSLPLLLNDKCDVVLESSLRKYVDEMTKSSFITGPERTDQAAFYYLLTGGERSHITPGATSFTKAIFNKTGEIDEELHYGEDGEFLLRLCLNGRVVLISAEPVVIYSIHGNNSSRAECLHYWQNIKSLSRLYKKMKNGNWAEQTEFIKCYTSAKLDYALTQYRRESVTYLARIKGGILAMRYFPFDCLTWNNFKSIVVWALKSRSS